MPSADLRTALKKRKPLLMIAGGFALLGALIPLAVAADDPTATQAAGVAADTVWVIVTGCLVMFMQAGFAMLEVGFSRMKNVGTVVAKVVTSFLPHIVHPLPSIPAKPPPARPTPGGTIEIELRTALSTSVDNQHFRSFDRDLDGFWIAAINSNVRDAATCVASLSGERRSCNPPQPFQLRLSLF